VGTPWAAAVACVDARQEPAGAAGAAAAIVVVVRAPAAAMPCVTRTNAWNGNLYAPMAAVCDVPALAVRWPAAARDAGITDALWSPTPCKFLRNQCQSHNVTMLIPRVRTAASLPGHKKLLRRKHNCLLKISRL
jgi:hypothetical protein